MVEEFMYVHCPVCGRELGKSGNGTNTLTNCNKCGSTLTYEVIGNAVRVRVMKASQKAKKSEKSVM